MSNIDEIFELFIKAFEPRKKKTTQTSHTKMGTEH